MPRGGVLAPAALALALAAAGCLTASQESRLQTDMAAVRQQSFDQQKATSEILAKIEGLEQALSRQEGASPTRFADLESLIQSLTDQVRSLGARIDDNTARMATVANEIALARQQYRALDARLAAALATRGLAGPFPAPGGTSALPEAASDSGGSAAPTAPDDSHGSGATPDSLTGGPAGSAAAPAAFPAAAGASGTASAEQEAAFRAAYADYTRGSWESALTGFQDFIESHPGSPLVEGAEYYAGDCLFNQQRFEESIKAFDRVIGSYPESEKAPAAHLNKGIALLALKQTARGVIQLQHVIDTYPKSEEARLARDRLRQLGLSVR